MLELKNICYEVEDNKEIIRDISLQIEDHFVAITGQRLQRSLREL